MLPILVLIVVLAFTVYLTQKGHEFYWGLMVGSVLLSLANGNSAAATARIFLEALTSARTIELIAAVTIITVLTSILSNCNLLERMVDNLSAFLSNPKLTLMGVPALIGGIPVTGGAIISAPLVGQLGPALALSNARMAAINIVFRHVCIFITPFRPHYILAASLSATPLIQMVTAQAPLTAIGLLAGYWFLLRQAPVKKQTPNSGRLTAGHNFLLYSSPLSAILVGAAFGLRLDVSLGLGLILAILLAWGHPNLNFKTILKGIKFPLIITMASIIIFSAAVNNVKVLPQLLSSTVDYGISLKLLVFAVPLIVGYVTADINACVALVFPLLLPLLPVESKTYYVAAIYANSLIAYMASPLHMCQVLTNDYFKINLFQIYREYWPVLLLLFAGILVLFTLSTL
ncbi:MAG: uncharacterized protein PWP65_1224 [Clostridia bacterium]|nr:uncharacterized protein [Clostridia bacterium]